MYLHLENREIHQLIQTNILFTDYYDIIMNDLEKLTKENKRLSDMLQQYLNITGNSLCGLTPVLKSLLKSAQRNAYAYPSQRKHSEVMTKFATALFIFSGSFTYEFLHKNLQQELPSARSIRAIQSQYKTLDEGVFRLNDLVNHLKNHKAPNIVSISEDATRVMG